MAEHGISLDNSFCLCNIGVTIHTLILLRYFDEDLRAISSKMPGIWETLAIMELMMLVDVTREYRIHKKV